MDKSKNILRSKIETYYTLVIKSVNGKKCERLKDLSYLIELKSFETFDPISKGPNKCTHI